MKPLYVVGAALIAEGRCLVAQRKGGDQAGRWEFPGGKVEPGEEPRLALARELREELCIETEIGRWLGRGRAASGERLIVLDVYQARLIAGMPEPVEHAAVAWPTPEALSTLDWAEADIPIVPAVVALLRAIEAAGLRE